MKTRRDFPDIARGALIILVVWGHLLESKGFNGRLYFAIYTFHIPAFAMIGGVFSKSKLDVKDVLSLCKRILFPLLVFQITYFFALGYFAPDRVSSLYIPVWIIWFLFSFLTWRLLLPVVLRLPCPFFLSVFAALLAGFVDLIGPELSLSRTFVFFPAFLFGHLYGDRIFNAVTRHRSLLIAVFIAFFGAALLISDNVSIRWLWGSQPFSQMPLDTPGIVFRAVTIPVGIIMSVAFLALLPEQSRSLAFLGRMTMPVYLLHGFAAILFWVSSAWLSNSIAFLALSAVLSVVIAFTIAWLVNLPVLKAIRRA